MPVSQSVNGAYKREWNDATNPPAGLAATVLEDPALIAIRETVRNFCQNGVHEVSRYVTFDPAELEDLWEIDSAASTPPRPAPGQRGRDEMSGATAQTRSGVS